MVVAAAAPPAMGVITTERELVGNNKDVIPVAVVVGGGSLSSCVCKTEVHGAWCMVPVVLLLACWGECRRRLAGAKWRDLLSEKIRKYRLPISSFGDETRAMVD